MMTSSNGNISSVTGHCARNSPVAGEFPAQRPVTRSFDGFSDLCLNKRLSKNGEAGDLRRHRAHYHLAVMSIRNMSLNLNLQPQFPGTNELGSLCEVTFLERSYNIKNYTEINQKYNKKYQQ